MPDQQRGNQQYRIEPARRPSLPGTGRYRPDFVDATRTARAAVATWHEVDKVLTPLLGARGVTALYRRSLRANVADYPWLRAADESGQAVIRFQALQSALSQQPRQVAAAASVALMASFRDELIEFVGEPMAGRLLRAVADPETRRCVFHRTDA